MLPKLRLFISRRIGFFLPPVGEWDPDPFGYFMRRLDEQGNWQYRHMTEVEKAEEMKARAW